MGNILVCEDDTPLREVYEMVLLSAGHTVDVAENGKKGIERCRRNRYDVILLDLMMPEVDGVEFLRRSKVTDTPSATRVIVLSNLSSGEEIDDALALGAERHVLKSDLTPRDLIELVQDLLGGYKSAKMQLAES